MINRFLTRLGLRQEPKPADMPKYPAWYLEMADARRWDVPSPEYYEMQADLMKKVSYLYTVVTLTANAAASQDFDVEIDGAVDEGHALEKLLDAPNPLYTGVELLRDTFIYRMLNGQAFWWLNVTSADDDPSEIWNIPPGNIEPVPDAKLGISHYEYHPGDGTTIILPTWQIIWFKGFHPSNPYGSLSGSVPLSLTMRTDIETQKFLSTVYGKNSGRLPGIIAFKSPVNDQDWRTIKRDVVSASNEGNYMLLRGVGDGVTWLQAAANLSEMETLRGREMTKADVYNTFAPGLFNMTDVSATEANAKVGKQTFAEFTLFPMLQALTGRLNKDVAPRYGEDVKVVFDDPRDLKAQQDAARMAIETQRVNVYSGYINAGIPAPVAAQMADLQLPDGMDYADLTPPPQAAPAPIQAQAAPVEQDDTANEIAAEMLKWQDFAAKRFGKASRPFECKAIPPALALRIQADLGAAKSADDIPAVFARAGAELPTIVLARAINRLTNG
jgi:phage portal protein BeeE